MHTEGFIRGKGGGGSGLEGTRGGKGETSGGTGVEGGPRGKATGKGGGGRGLGKRLGDVVGKWCGGAVGEVG